ncbi:RAD protein [Plasmodium ovale]|uniref:RAD protein n=1 Tax=Plasmodium ovale TaxID=36330 RepID=A0A1C3KR82_PLAOA|nr:RAD protein [Plasmodium ovale]
MNFGKIILSQGIVSIFIVLLNTLNNVISTKADTSKLQSSSECQRKLAEASQECSTVFEKVKLAREKRKQFKGKLPFGCKQSDLNKNLTPEEMVAPFKSIRSFKNEKEIFIAVYYFTEYLNRIYKRMMHRLKTMCMDLAWQFNMPLEELREFCRECEEALTEKLEKMNDEANKSLLSHIQRKLMRHKLYFLYFLYNYRESWFKNMNNIESIWVEKFNVKIRKLRNENNNKEVNINAEKKNKTRKNN